jgi:hypothetical protein
MYNGPEQTNKDLVRSVAGRGMSWMEAGYKIVTSPRRVASRDGASQNLCCSWIETYKVGCALKRYSLPWWETYLRRCDMCNAPFQVWFLLWDVVA